LSPQEKAAKTAQLSEALEIKNEGFQERKNLHRHRCSDCQNSMFITIHILGKK
jgi:hypothetical protein